MDPNANLRELRALIAQLRQEEDNEQPHSDYDIDRMIDLVAALDFWISRGGFLPDSWEMARKRAEARP